MLPEPQSFAEIAVLYRRGIDFRIVERRRTGSSVAIVAPHGGAIERATSSIARALAGEDFNLYLFEGLLPAHNHERLHLTSHRFDEPACLALIASCDSVVTIHGCNARPGEPDPGVLLGGLDLALRACLAKGLREAGVPVLDEATRFPATNPRNICNRGRRGVGVQIELTGAIRGGPQEAAFARAVRAVLLALPAA